MIKRMELTQIPIENLIPQRPPFIMVDEVLSCNNRDAVIRFEIQEDNIFINEDHFAVAGIIENMAQSCAARMGYINAENGEKVKIGVIGDIKNLVIHRLPQCNDILITHVSIVEEVFNLTMADVVTKIGDEVIASARMKIACVD